MPKTSEMDLRDYGRILVRRKWWIVTSVLVGLGLAFTLNTITRPVYRATARLQISHEPARSPLTGELIDNPSSRSENLALYTTAELITNRRMIARVIETLKGQHVLTGAEGMPTPWYGSFLRGRAAAASPVEAATTPVSEDEVDWFLAQLTVEPVPDTWLVKIHALMPSPRSAEQVANAVADEFVRSQAELHNQGSSSTVRYLTDQIEQVRTALQQSEQASAYYKARTDRIAAEGRLAQVQAAADGQNVDLDQLPTKSASLETIRKQLLDSDNELAKARQVYKEHHPRLVLLESENESIHQSLRHELSSALASAQQDYRLAMARERSLGGAPGAGRDPALIDSDVQNNRDLYNTLVTKLKEAEMTGQSTGPLVQVVEPAAADPDPVRPRKLLNFLVCALAGFVIGTGLAFLREYLRRTIRTPQDVDDYLQLPVLGLIPKA